MGKSGSCGCGHEHSDEERRSAVQAALEKQHKKGKKGSGKALCYSHDGPRVREMYGGHAIVASGGYDSENHAKHPYTLSHDAAGKLQAQLGEGRAVTKKWQEGAPPRESLMRRVAKSALDEVKHVQKKGKK